VSKSAISKRTIHRAILAFSVVAGLSTLSAAPARAEFPDKPIKALVGFTPGGSSDVLMRLVANAVSPMLGQPVVVENRTGANGLLAANETARSPADGHTVYQCPMSPLAISPQLIGAKVPVDAGAEMTPIANIALSSYALVVPASSPYRKVADVIAAARAEPGRLTFASVGNGSAQHLSAEMLKRLEKIDMVHVPYRGSPPAILDLIAGRVDFMINNIADVGQHVQSGKLRLLGQGDPSKFPVFPDAPRIADTVKGFEVTGWFGVCGPRNMPEKVVRRWAQVIEQAMKDPSLQRKLQDAGVTPYFEGPDTFARRLKGDRARWLTVIREGNVRAE
jgi:tripartite-type tricarboxylate transporter receptor subunit TctC